MTYDVGMTTTERIPLNRERVIEAAVAYADSHGLEDLSMRKLGAELGVEAMSLYNHVDNKDDILDSMIDHVFSKIPLPEQGAHWKTQIRQVGEAAMRSFGDHPWVPYLLMQRGNFGPGALQFMDRTLAVLESAGLSEADQHHAWQMLASHTMGYAFQRGANPGGEVKDYAAAMAALSQFPHVGRLAPLLVQCQWDDEYMFGLEIIIDGLAARID